MKSAYYDLLDLPDRDMAYSKAVKGIMSVKEAIYNGEVNPEPYYKDLFRKAAAYINNYRYQLNKHRKSEAQIMPNELARMRLTIIQWWAKCLTHVDHKIHPIQTIFEGCTDDPRMLESYLGFEVGTVENAPKYVVDYLDDVAAHTCPICGCVKTYIIKEVCRTCRNSEKRRATARARICRSR
ncbi:hypothetical protein EE88_21690 [Salmonella enterica]|nr:hypothetical protein [Salmonella enterica]